MKKKEIIRELERRIDVMKHHAKGGEIEYHLTLKEIWCSIEKPDWLWDSINYRKRKYGVLAASTIDSDFLKDKEIARVKTYITPTREEITAKWVSDKDLEVGDTVRVDKIIDTDPMWFPAMTRLVGQGEVTRIINSGIVCGGHFSPVEALTKVTKKIVPFRFEDYALFLGKDIRLKGELNPCQISGINSKQLLIGAYFYSYKEALGDLEFADGSPFGKEEIS
jgi:hypothetical protein